MLGRSSGLSFYKEFFGKHKGTKTQRKDTKGVIELGVFGLKE